MDKKEQIRKLVKTYFDPDQMSDHIEWIMEFVEETYGQTFNFDDIECDWTLTNEISDQITDSIYKNLKKL